MSADAFVASPSDGGVDVAAAVESFAGRRVATFRLGPDLDNGRRPRLRWGSDELPCEGEAEWLSEGALSVRLGRVETLVWDPASEVARHAVTARLVAVVGAKRLPKQLRRLERREVAREAVV